MKLDFEPRQGAIVSDIRNWERNIGERSPQQALLVLTVVLIRETWNSPVKRMEIPRKDFHLNFRKLIGSLGDLGDMERQLGLVWNESEQGYEELDRALRCLEGLKVFNSRQRSGVKTICFHVDTQREANKLLSDYQLEADENRPLKAAAVAVVKAYEDEAPEGRGTK